MISIIIYKIIINYISYLLFYFSLNIIFFLLLLLVVISGLIVYFFFSSRRRHTRCYRDWSSDVCSSDLLVPGRRYRRCRRPDVHLDGGEGRSRRASSPVRARALGDPWPPRRGPARATARHPQPPPPAGPRRQSDRRLERPPAGRSGRGGSPAGALRLARRRPAPRRVPARAAVHRRATAPQLPGRPFVGCRVPRGLRLRGQRPLRAARGDR